MASFINRCISFYTSLSDGVCKNGLNEKEINSIFLTLTDTTKKIFLLKEQAYHPSGIALGCPLPDKNCTNQFWEISNQINTQLGSFFPGKADCYAFVPREYYHITVLNKSHYHNNKTTIGPQRSVEGRIASAGKFNYLNNKEKEAIKNTLPDCTRIPITIRFNGLILTPGGAVLIPGYPREETLYKFYKKEYF